MASIGEIVDRLGSIKKELDGSKTATDRAGERTEKMSTLADGMDLDDIATGLRVLGTRIEEMGERIVRLGENVDGLVVMAETLRRGSGAGSGVQAARPFTVEGQKPEADSHMNPLVQGTPVVPPSPKKVRPDDGAEPSSQSRDAAAGHNASPRKSRLPTMGKITIVATSVGAVWNTATTFAHLPVLAQGLATAGMGIVAVWQSIKADRKNDDD